MTKYAVFYTVNGEHYVNTITCFQFGEAYNWTIEDASEKHHCKPSEVKIESVIQMI